MTAIQSTPLSQRSTLRSQSNATLIPVSNLGKMRKKGCFLRPSNAVKPFLTDVNKIARLNLENSFVNPRTQKFDNMYNYVHIDEKCFYITKINIRTTTSSLERHCCTKHVKVRGISRKSCSCVWWLIHEAC